MGKPSVCRKTLLGSKDEVLWRVRGYAVPSQYSPSPFGGGVGVGAGFGVLTPEKRLFRQTEASLWGSLFVYDKIFSGARGTSAAMSHRRERGCKPRRKPPPHWGGGRGVGASFARCRCSASVEGKAAAETSPRKHPSSEYP